MISKYFVIEELVDKATYEARCQLAWELIDPRLITFIDKLKAKFPNGTCTVNNWKWGGDRQWSGLRTPESPYYSKYSQHTFGRAIDCIFSDYTTKEVREYIIKYQEDFPEVKGVEIAGWCHFDLRNTVDDKLKVFKP
jgi:hypothetical protein